MLYICDNVPQLNAVERLEELNYQLKNKVKMEHENLNKPQNTNSDLGDVNRRLNVYEYIWSKEFPNEELNYDDFYDWSGENANRALNLALEYCDLNGC